jgi:hypothetical protein
VRACELIFANTYQSREKARHTVYVKRDTEARISNHWCSGKAESIMYSECVFVALGIQHAMCLRIIVMWLAPLYNTSPHYLINGTIFEKKKLFNTKCIF